MLDSGNIYLRDLSSTNGTFLNGSRLLDNSKINVGDSIQMGEITIRVARAFIPRLNRECGLPKLGGYCLDPKR